MSLARCTGCGDVLDTDADPDSCEHVGYIHCPQCREDYEGFFDEKKRQRERADLMRRVEDAVISGEGLFEAAVALCRPAPTIASGSMTERGES